jgi:hypothetical protein
MGKIQNRFSHYVVKTSLTSWSLSVIGAKRAYFAVLSIPLTSAITLAFALIFIILVLWLKFKSRNTRLRLFQRLQIGAKIVAPILF